MFEQLSMDPFAHGIDWHHCEIFFSDERFVPPDSPESNFRLAHDALLSKVPVREAAVHPVPTVNVQPQEGSEMYERTVRTVVPSDGVTAPRFDLILLGLGPDGHTASLFPGTAALRLHDRLVAPNYVPSLDAWRITFTYSLINAAWIVAFLVEGAAKAERVAQVLAGTPDLPASGVRPSAGQLLWLLDAAAASRW
jgi:6-phosphogluconolactonase